MRYAWHHVLESGHVLLAVTERERRWWFGVVEFERRYTFVPGVGRWLDERGEILLATDPRHFRLSEIWVARAAAEALDDEIFKVGSG